MLRSSFLQEMARSRGFRPQEFVEEAQNAIQRVVESVQISLGGVFRNLSHRSQGQEVRPMETVRIEEERTAAPVKATVEEELAEWRRNSFWTDLPPKLEVTVPKGCLCKLESEFTVGIPPNAVFDILIDPENKRVFKDIQAVSFREVIEDDGDRQLVELEQLAIWRFLWFSGTLNVRLFVDQDRRSHSLKFWLAREGFMKKFEGSWQVEPLYVGAGDSLSSVPTDSDTRVASLVKLNQELQPALLPPPPVSWYVRGITAKTTEQLLSDLQAEGKRLREGTTVEQMAEAQLQEKIDKEMNDSAVFRRQVKASVKKKAVGANRRRARRSN